MNLTRYEPWSLVNRLNSDLDRLWNSELSRLWNDGTRSEVVEWTPAVDIRETKDAFVVTADLPGVEPNNIEVTMESGVLTIRGRREHESNKEENGYKRVERVTGEFFRRFSLPDTADADAITARTQNGVLTLTIPKRAEVQPRRIEVRSN